MRLLLASAVLVFACVFSMPVAVAAAKRGERTLDELQRVLLRLKVGVSPLSELQMAPAGGGCAAARPRARADAPGWPRPCLFATSAPGVELRSALSGHDAGDGFGTAGVDPGACAQAVQCFQLLYLRLRWVVGYVTGCLIGPRADRVKRPRRITGDSRGGRRPASGGDRGRQSGRRETVAMLTTGWRF